MSGTIDPKPPSEGWEKRWLVEAAKLVCLNPAATGVLLFGMFASGAAKETIGGFSPGIDAFLSLFVSLYVGLFFAHLSTRMVARSEGYARDFSGLRSLASLARSASGFFLLISAYVGFMTGHLHAARDGSLGLPDQGVREGAWLYLVSGSENVISAMVFASLLGFLAVPCFSLLNVRYDEGVRLLVRAVNVCRHVVMKSVCFIVPLVILADRIPSLVAIAAGLMMVFWSYVAGREIFGGISGNRHKIRIPKPFEA